MPISVTEHHNRLLLVSLICALDLRRQLRRIKIGNAVLAYDAELWLVVACNCKGGKDKVYKRCPGG